MGRVSLRGLIGNVNRQVVERWESNTSRQEAGKVIITFRVHP